MSAIDSRKFEEIEKAVHELNWYWKYFNEIFIGINPFDRLELLQSASPIFFGLCRTAFYEQLMLIIARLCDPATSRVKGVDSDNLSLKNLIQCLPKIPSALQLKIDNFNQVVDSNYGSIKTLRDKKIAHTDSSVKLGLQQISSPLESEVIKLIDAINSLCSAINMEYKGQSIVFTPYSTDNAKSEHLFNVLRVGIANVGFDNVR